MNLAAIIVIAAAASGALALPRQLQILRRPRETDCSSIVYRPFSPASVVCGSDGKTYVNEKHLEFENCINNAEATVEKTGWCEEETQVVESLKELFWQLLSVVFDEVFDDLDLDEETTQMILGFLSEIVNDEESGENTSDSAEELINFLKNLDLGSDESSESLDNFWKFLESLNLDSSEEKADRPKADTSENEIPNEESNVISDIIPEAFRI